MEEMRKAQRGETEKQENEKKEHESRGCINLSLRCFLQFDHKFIQEEDLLQLKICKGTSFQQLAKKNILSATVLWPNPDGAYVYI